MVVKTALDNFRYGRPSLTRVEDAMILTRDWCSRLPLRYDLLIGVPRSGLMVASFMSTELNIPLSVPEILPSYWSTKSDPRPINNILIVEDGATLGTHLIPVKEKTVRTFPTALVHIGALYSVDGGISLDTWGTKVHSWKSVLEWDLSDSRPYQNIAVDMDGVLCQECPPCLTEDEYINWMETATPHLIPPYQIEAVITSRREKYRAITEGWLRRNGVRYVHLLMDPSIKDSDRDFIGWKIRCINYRKPQVFIESDERIAQVIHWKTGVPVICSTSMKMFQR